MKFHHLRLFLNNACPTIMPDMTNISIRYKFKGSLFPVEKIKMTFINAPSRSERDE